MALTKTIAEVKAMLPNFVSNLSDIQSLPNFDAAEYKYLVPITGVGLFNDIHTKYNADTALSADETNLLKKMRLVAVAYAYHDGLILGHITLTDNGARKFNPNNTVPVAKWEYEKLERTLLAVAYDATEVLLRFLFEKKASFALWTASDEYAGYNALLIKTGTDFHAQYNLYQPMRTFFNIRTVIADVQEMYLKAALGEELLKNIISTDAPDATLKPIVNKLKKALAFFTIKHCCEHYNVRFSSEGFTVLGEGGTDSADHAGRKVADPSDLDMKMNACDKQGDHFLSLAIDELVSYYKSEEVPLPSSEFKEALEEGPLNSLLSVTEEPTSGNETRKGVFRL